MNRIHNFSAGPSILPLEVLEKAAREMTCYEDSGMSVMEMSHRSAVYEGIINRARELFVELMNIPENYEVLFLQGGASTQFAAIPLNLLNGSGRADFLVTGVWAKKALQEASLFGTASTVASSADKTFSYIPKTDPSTFDKEADYFHITQNNTIYGTRITSLPETGAVPLVCDWSSGILSEVIDVSKYGVIYAGAQKNIGPAGLTVVIVRKDLIGRHREVTPTMLRYDIAAKEGSMYNTPPTYAIYICKLVLEWLAENGGVAAMQKTNEHKAALLYDYLDNSSLFKPTVFGDDRSLMNIPFVTGNEELDKAFVKSAEAAGFVNLKGHRSVGGMRASIYNAMPVKSVEALLMFMKDFESKNK